MLHKSRLAGQRMITACIRSSAMAVQFALNHAQKRRPLGSRMFSLVVLSVALRLFISIFSINHREKYTDSPLRKSRQV